MSKVCYRGSHNNSTDRWHDQIATRKEWRKRLWPSQAAWRTLEDKDVYFLCGHRITGSPKNDKKQNYRLHLTRIQHVPWLKQNSGCELKFASLVIYSFSLLQWVRLHFGAKEKKVCHVEHKIKLTLLAKHLVLLIWLLLSVKSRQTIFLPGKLLSRNAIVGLADFVVERGMNQETNSKVGSGLCEQDYIARLSCSKVGYCYHWKTQ